MSGGKEMKRWNMIHKIKALYDNGAGLSFREISRRLGISRQTVKKYLELDEGVIDQKQQETRRKKLLDKHRDYVIHLLKTYPNLSAVKVARKLRAKCEIEGSISERTIRRYVGEIKSVMPTKQKRYYEPVIDMLPGIQCQIDGGELLGVEIGGKLKKVYFLVFVLSYSRLMYVSISDKAISTELFIQMHDEAFRYFGGMPEECVYDQTKLVAIEEIFREVKYNQDFYRYATTVGFKVHVCEGYDPESKGKVEAGVKYVKENFFYGENFASLNDVKQSCAEWLDGIANKRTHGTTKRIPAEMYIEEEQAKMLPYHGFTMKEDAVLRKADKTSLISYKSNKYSVPMEYQETNIAINEADGYLFASDIKSGEVIAKHIICLSKGMIIKNRNHYRDYSKKIEDYEYAIKQITGEALAAALCGIIKRTEPKIYKDQLVGLKKVLPKYSQLPNYHEILAILADKPKLTVRMLQEYLEAYSNAANKQYDEKPLAQLAKYNFGKGGI